MASNTNNPHKNNNATKSNEKKSENLEEAMTEKVNNHADQYDASNDIKVFDSGN